MRSVHGLCKALCAGQSSDAAAIGSGSHRLVTDATSSSNSPCLTRRDYRTFLTGALCFQTDPLSRR